jgi:hypothetical protein
MMASKSAGQARRESFRTISSRDPGSADNTPETPGILISMVRPATTSAEPLLEHHRRKRQRWRINHQLVNNVVRGNHRQTGLTTGFVGNGEPGCMSLAALGIIGSPAPN